MTISEIKEWIAVVRKAGIVELEVKSGENSVRIRGAAGVAQETMIPVTHMVPTFASVAAPAEPARSAQRAVEELVREHQGDTDHAAAEAFCCLINVTYRQIVPPHLRQRYGVLR